MEDNNLTNPTPSEASNQEPQFRINESKLKAYVDSLKIEQNLNKGFIYGLIGALVAAVIWATVTIITGYQIGYMALAVGFIVGYAVRMGGKGLDPIFGIMGAILALIGCVLGNYFSVIGAAANEYGLGYFEMLNQIEFGLIPSILKETFSPMDVLFYGFALYEGYNFSFRQISEEEILDHASEKIEVNSLDSNT